MSGAVIEFASVGKRYGGFASLSELSFQVGEAEVLALLGHNGAGKTTTMKLILGLIEADSGKARVFGEDPAGPRAQALRQRLGYLPENVSFYEELSGREVLAYFARLKRVERARVDELLERVGLAAAAARRVKTYSKGMRQRLGLAQALLGQPRLLLLDEPTTGLDPMGTREFYQTVQELKRGGCTVILSSHVLPGVEPYLDRALILGGGRRLACGSLDELRAQAGLPIVVRAGGAGAAEGWAADGVEARALAGDQLELRVTPAAKMTTLRRLAAAPGVHDIELMPPTLEHLYVHFASQPAEASA